LEQLGKLQKQYELHDRSKLGLFFSVIDGNAFQMTEKKLSHFGQNVSKYRLMNTVTASFNTTVRQMTEMSQ